MKLSRKQALHLLREDPLMDGRASNNELTLALVAIFDDNEIVVGDADIHEKWMLRPDYNSEVRH